MYILLMKLITNVYNTILFTVSRSSVIKNKKRISKIEKSYRMSVFVLNHDDLPLKTLIIVIQSVKKLCIQQINISKILWLWSTAISLL